MKYILDDIRYFLFCDPLVTALIVACVGFFAFLGIDFLCHTTTVHAGVLIEKHYVPGSESSGSGWGVGHNGKPVYIITHSSAKEKFILLVKATDGSVWSVESDPSLFFAKNPSDSVRFEVNEGRLSGMDLGKNALR